jgi:hypothetical protein
VPGEIQQPKINRARIASRIFVAMIASLLCSSNLLMAAVTNETPQILFLHLRMKENAVSLVGCSTGAGVVKPQPNLEARELQYELLSASGEVVWKGGLNDASLNSIEYEDPPRSGRLKRKAIRANDVEFTVRVPLISSAERLEFFRWETLPEDARSGKKAPRKPLGSVRVGPTPVLRHE